MKRRLAWWAARSTAADRLARGSAIVWQRRADALMRWVRAGRRDDLTGWQAALGPAVRLVLLGVVAYAVWAVVRAVPWLMWALAALWCRAAWKAGRGTPADAPSEGRHAPPDEVYEATLTWVREQIADRQGVHLRDLLAHAQAHGMFEGLEVSDLKGHLERWDIPVRKRVRVRGRGVTVGIHRDDLAASSHSSPAAASEEAA